MATKTSIEVVAPSTLPVVKIGVIQPFQIVGAETYTSIEYRRDRAAMVETDRGVLVTISSKLKGPAAPPPTTFLVPWGAVTYVLYGRTFTE